jgi:hypothetical protein
MKKRTIYEATELWEIERLSVTCWVEWCSDIEYYSRAAYNKHVAWHEQSNEHRGLKGRGETRERSGGCPQYLIIYIIRCQNVRSLRMRNITETHVPFYHVRALLLAWGDL